MPKILRLDDVFDMKVLRFLWTWKVSTTAAIATAIGSKRKLINVYQRLIKLEHEKFIRTHSTPNGFGRVWLLDARGFQTIQGHLPRLIENGFKSEHIFHDLLCHAIQLGDWIGQSTEACSVFSEQQLRRINPDFYPPWVPNTPSHRPDGWWHVDNGSDKRLVALEVELSLKDTSTYESVGEFYSDLIKIDRTIWLVNGQTDGLYIQRHLKSGAVSGPFDHSFFFLSDFIQHGWQSPVRIGKDVGKLLTEVLNTTAKPTLFHGIGMVILDVRKKPIKPKGSRSPSVSDFL